MNRRIIYIYVIIIDVFTLLFFILSMIYTSKIKNGTSSGNPFELEEESDKMNYFKNNITSNYPDKAYCICGDDTFLDYCNEELLKSGCKNLSIKNEIKNLRKFTQCEEIQNKIINGNFKLKNIFEIKTDSIHSLITTLIALNIAIFIMVILYFPCFEFWVKRKEEEFNDYYKAKQKEKEEQKEEGKKKSIFSDFLDWCDTFCRALSLVSLIYGILFLISIAILIILIIIIIIFSIVCGLYNSDDTSKYLDFLDCTNVNKVGFYKFSSLEDLSSHFIALKIVQSFYMIFVFISGFYTFSERFFKHEKIIFI